MVLARPCTNPVLFGRIVCELMWNLQRRRSFTIGGLGIVLGGLQGEGSDRTKRAGTGQRNLEVSLFMGGRLWIVFNQNVG